MARRTACPAVQGMGWGGVAGGDKQGVGCSPLAMLLQRAETLGDSDGVPLDRRLVSVRQAAKQALLRHLSETADAGQASTVNRRVRRLTAT